MNDAQFHTLITALDKSTEYNAFLLGDALQEERADGKPLVLSPEDRTIALKALLARSEELRRQGSLLLEVAQILTKAPQ